MLPSGNVLTSQTGRTTTSNAVCRRKSFRHRRPAGSNPAGPVSSLEQHLNLRCAGALLLVAAVPATARAEAGEPRSERFVQLAPFGGADLIAAPSAAGGAVVAGLRLGLGEHFAATLDLGYGLLGSSANAQDRWWAMPTAAYVLRIAWLRLDLGAGFGLGTSSGYESWAQYGEQPFTPVWHYTVPAARLHVMAATEVARDLDLFVRVEEGLLFVSGAWRPAGQITWFGLSTGVLWDVL